MEENAKSEFEALKLRVDRGENLSELEILKLRVHVLGGEYAKLYQRVSELEVEKIRAFVETLQSTAFATQNNRLTQLEERIKKLEEAASPEKGSSMLS
jgi:hypothetical protein